MLEPERAFLSDCLGQGPAVPPFQMRHQARAGRFAVRRVSMRRKAGPIRSNSAPRPDCQVPTARFAPAATVFFCCVRTTMIAVAVPRAPPHPGSSHLSFKLTY
jgi:hypothetical protein